MPIDGERSAPKKSSGFFSRGFDVVDRPLYEMALLVGTGFGEGPSTEEVDSASRAKTLGMPEERF